MEPEGLLQGWLQVNLHRDASDPGSEVSILQLPLLDHAENDGNPGSENVAVFQHEIKRGSERGDHEVDLRARVFIPKELRQSALMFTVREADGIKVFVIEHDVLARSLERGTKAFVMKEDARLAVADWVEHEDSSCVVGRLPRKSRERRTVTPAP